MLYDVVCNCAPSLFFLQINQDCSFTEALKVGGGDNYSRHSECALGSCWLISQH